MIPTIFFGTHTFAATILEALLNDPNIAVKLIITQPDRPIGREQKIKAGPVKELAIAHNIPVEQPQSLKNWKLSASGGEIRNLKLGVTAQYGGIIPKHILATPEFGIINVHTSLLPKYRGASPIQSAIMNGDTETGVTIMKMDEGLDTGPILLQKKVSIKPDETYPELEARLAKLGSETLLEAIPKYIKNYPSPIRGGRGRGLIPQPQDESEATFCKQLTREDGKIDWSRTAQEIYNQYRGLTPWPGVWTMWNGKRLKLLGVRTIVRDKVDDHPPGTLTFANDKLLVQTGSGQIEILVLQLEGKKSMDAKTFLMGYHDFDCSILSSS